MKPFGLGFFIFSFTRLASAFGETQYDPSRFTLTHNRTGFMFKGGMRDFVIDIYGALIADPAKSRTILELGPGEGEIPVNLMRHRGSAGTRIFAVDKDPEHLRVMGDRGYAALGRESAREQLILVTARGSSVFVPLDFSKEKLHAFVALRVLHQLSQSQIEDFLGEVFENLEEGGEILITMESVNLAFIPETMREQYLAGDQQNFLHIPNIGLWFADRTGLRSFATPQSLSATAGRAGFTQVRCEFIPRSEFPQPDLLHADPAKRNYDLSVGYFGFKPYRDGSRQEEACARMLALAKPGP